MNSFQQMTQEILNATTQDEVEAIYRRVEAEGDDMLIDAAMEFCLVRHLELRDSQ